MDEVATPASSTHQINNLAYPLRKVCRPLSFRPLCAFTVNGVDYSAGFGIRQPSWRLSSVVSHQALYMLGVGLALAKSGDRPIVPRMT
jgi:hypothetical protein